MADRKEPRAVGRRAGQPDFAAGARRGVTQPSVFDAALKPKPVVECGFLRFGADDEAGGIFVGASSAHRSTAFIGVLSAWIVPKHSKQLHGVGMISCELVRRPIAANDDVLCHDVSPPAVAAPRKH